MAKKTKRELILEALERLLPGRRFHEITLDEVAREAGVGKGTIYLYFKNKEALIAALAGYCMNRLAAELETLSGRDTTCRAERAAAVIGNFLKHHYAWVGAMQEVAGTYKNFDPEISHELESDQRNALHVLAKLLEPLLPPERRSGALDAARMLFWVVQGEVQSEMLNLRPAPDKKFLLDVFLRGIQTDFNHSQK